MEEWSCRERPSLSILEIQGFGDSSVYDLTCKIYLVLLYNLHFYSYNLNFSCLNLNSIGFSRSAKILLQYYLDADSESEIPP